MTQAPQIKLRLDGERIVWTAAGFRGFTDRGRRLATDLDRAIKRSAKPGDEPSLTRWTEARLRELDDPGLEILDVRFGPADGTTPTGTEA